MRINIVLDEQLVKQAFKYVEVTTKCELIDLALREFVEHHQKRDVRELLGEAKIASDYDYKKLREVQ